jgi:hypothetical protein
LRFGRESFFSGLAPLGASTVFIVPGEGI